MLVKENNAIVEKALSAPNPGQKAWIDVDARDTNAWHQVLAILAWDQGALGVIDLSSERAQMQLFGPLSVLSVFVPEGDAIKNFTIILGPNVLVTAHREPLDLTADLARDLPSRPQLLDSAHYLLYELLERVSDQFLELLDRDEEEFDAMEESVLNGQDRAHDVFALRHRLHHLRSILADLRRIAARLSRRQFTASGTGESDANIFVDVYDGFYHVIDNIDSLRDNLTGLVDLQLNQRSTRLNEIMKFLTIFSTIFLPLSFITGFFGMNFIKSMPELNIPFGQELVLMLMMAVAGVMLWVFKRRKWL